MELVADKLAGWLNNTTINETTTKGQYRTQINEAIKAQDVKHYDFDRSIDTLIKKYPDRRTELLNIKNTNALIVRGAMNELGKKDKTLKDELSEIEDKCYIITILNEYGISKNDKNKEIERQKKKLDESINHKEVIRYADINAIIQEGLKSDSYARLAVALALATGRRSIEVLYTGTFKELHGSIKSLEFTGQAKKRKGTEVESYPIYTICCSASEVIKGIKKLRDNKHLRKIINKAEKLPEHERNRYIKSKTQSTRGEATIRAFNYDFKRKFKDTRAIYTRHCLTKYYTKGGDSYYQATETRSAPNELAFLKDLLGHSGYKDQQNYLHFEIDYALPVSQKKNAPKKFGRDADKMEITDKTIFDKLDSIIEAMTEKPDGTKLHPRTKNAVLNLNHNVKAYALANPNKPINKTVIVKKIGCSKNVADIYAGNKKRDGTITKGIAESVLAEYNKTIKK